MTGRRSGLVAALVRAVPVPAVLVTLLLSVGAAPAGARPDDPGRGEVRLQVTSLTPAATAGAPFEVHGTITNTGGVALQDVRVQLARGGTATSRGALAQLRADTVGTPVPVTAPLRTGRTPVPPGGSRDFGVTLTDGRSLGLGPGVSTLSLLVTGLVAGVPQDLGRVDALVPFFDARPESPLRAALVLPVTAPPLGAAAAVGSPDAAPDPALLAALAPGGRLDTLLRGAAAATGGAVVTLAVDPALVRQVCALARLCGLTGAPATGAGVAAQQVAGDWYRQLGTVSALPGVRVSALPYGDADLVALAAAGPTERATALRLLGAGDASGEARARALSTYLLPGSSNTTTSPVLPPDGLLTPEAVDLARDAGATTAVVSDAVLPPPPAAGGGPTTPTAASVLTGSDGRTLGALVTDTGLQQLLARGDPAGQPRLAAQELLAETAAIVEEAPNSRAARALVLVAPRDWAPTAAYLTELVGDLGAVPWLRSVDAAAAAAADPVPRAAGPLDTVDVLPRDVLDDVAGLRGLVRSLGDALEPTQRRPQTLTPPLEEALDRAVSAAWRGAGGAAGSRLRDDVRARVGALRAEVQVGVGAQRTLTGASGLLPLTLSNGLPERIHVLVQVQSTPPDQVTSLPQDFLVPAATGGTATNEQVAINVTARATGRNQVTIRVLSFGGARGDVVTPLQVEVTSTAYGVVAVGITVGALTVLVLAFVVRGVRWGLRRRRGRPPAAPAPPGALGAGAA